VTGRCWRRRLSRENFYPPPPQAPTVTHTVSVTGTDSVTCTDVAGNTGTATSPQIRIDRALFGDPIPTVRLQAALNTAGQLAWFDYLLWAVYMTHYFATLLIAAVLWRFAYQRFREFRRMVLTLATFGFVTYVLFPAVPPWMASQMHQLDPTRRTHDGLLHVVSTIRPPAFRPWPPSPSARTARAGAA